MIVDVPPNTFRATVEFPRAGLYEVAVAGFDPRHRARSTDIGPPVRIDPAPPAIAALVAGAWSIQRVRVRASG